LGLSSEEVSSSPKDDGLDEVNEAILLALSDESFSSVRQIAHRICVPKSTVYRISPACRFSAFHS
jgi:DNA-binding MurR/RpiR family transcriptional regulator